MSINSQPRSGGSLQESRIGWSTAVLVAVTLSLSILWFPTSQIYFTNVREFPVLFYWLALTFASMAIVATLFIAAMVLLVPERLRHVAIAAAIGIAWLTWVQSNFLVWDYGVLAGQSIHWQAFWRARLLEYIVWSGGIVVAVRYARQVARRAFGSCSLLLVVQTVGLLLLSASAPAANDATLYTVSTRNEFTFSSSHNVFVVVLDMFQSDVFDELVRSDADLASRFTGFVNFRNTVGGFGATYASLTFLLTGRQYDNSAPLPRFIERAFLSESSLPARLKADGYDVGLYSTAPEFIHLDTRTTSNLERKHWLTWTDGLRLLKFGLFRCFPQDVKRAVVSGDSWFAERLGALARREDVGDRDGSDDPGVFSPEELNRFDASQINEPRWLSDLERNGGVTTSQPVMRFYHLRGPHYPLRMNERLEFERLPDTREGYARQAKGALIVVARFLEQLKRYGIYDRSLIVIAGDHGYRGPANGMLMGVHPPDGVACPAPTATPGFLDPNQKGSAMPLLLVKRLSDRLPLRVSDAAVSLGDVPPTILADLHLTAAGFGESVFAPNNPLRSRLFVQDEMTPMRPDGYYAPMREFSVRGPVWCDASWHLQRVLSPAQ